MDRVFVALDGSPWAERALPLAHLLAQILGARLELVQVLEDRLAYGVFSVKAERSADAVESYLTHLAERVGDGAAVGIRLPRGRPAQVLLQLAEDTPDAIIVLSTHGRGGLGRAVLGSVADTVARGAACPVVLVRDGSQPSTPQLARLLVALDGSRFAEGALPVATQLAQRSGAELCLIRVVPPLHAPAARFGPRMTYPGAYGDRGKTARLERHALLRARRYLGRVVEQLAEHGLRVSGEVQLGDPAQELTAAAERRQVELILIASRRQGGLRRWALGSVAAALLRRSTVPVVIVPQAMATHAVASEQAAVP